MQVRDALLPNPVITSPEEIFKNLVTRLTDRQHATAAVVDGEKVVGLVGIHDILRKIVPHYIDLDTKLMEVMHDGYFEERLARLREIRVRDFMDKDFDCVEPDDALIKAVALIVESGRNTLPVVENGRFVGIVTRRHILEQVVARSTQLD